MKELQFPEEFFQDEEREGFFVEKMMKHAWAAQLVVLKDIDDVCQKHGIKWFADYGTLLGAIRHKGFIPWDDDIDISMMRADYEKFLHVAAKDLPKGYQVIGIHNTPDWDDYLLRVVNHINIDVSDEVMNRFYNCPFALGIDITPIDYIPTDKEEKETFKALLEATAHGANVYEDEKTPMEDKKAMVARIEKVFKVKIHRGRPVAQQLRELADRFMSMYGPNDTNMIGPALRVMSVENYWVEADTVDELIEVPFEGTTIPVPKEYDRYLKFRFGSEYMTPVQYVSHDYPFYKDQRKLIDEFLANGTI